MATIQQALDVLKKAGADITVEENVYSCRNIITIKIPLGTPWVEEIEGTKAMVDVHTASICKNEINTAVYGFSSQAERVAEVMDEKAKNLKDFENQFFGTYKIPEVREIRYNGPATIVFWEDNTKTVVKMQPGEMHYDPDKAFAMAVCKKLFGNKFNRHLTKAQKAYEKSYEEKCEKWVEGFIKNPEKIMCDFLDNFDKMLGKRNLSVGTFDPNSVTTFKPKKEE